MAVKNAKRAAGKGFIYDNPKPSLNVYELDTDKIMTDFRTIRLEGYSKQWLDFIFRCYTDIHFVHHYDVVFGNAVTAEIQDIISPYRYGKISEAEVLDRLSSMPGTEQICFSTAPALEELKYLENVQLKKIQQNDSQGLSPRESFCLANNRCYLFSNTWSGICCEIRSGLFECLTIATPDTNTQPNPMAYI